jgi:hypothetical protein
MLRYFCCLSLLGLLCLAGCTSYSMPPLPKVYPVRGKIVQADGTPLAYGHILFTPRTAGKGNPCSCYLNSDGTFDKVLTYNGAWGAVPGKYLLHLEPTNNNDKGFFKGNQKDLPVIPEKYKNAQTAELVFEIKAEDNDLGTITLK